MHHETDEQLEVSLGNRTALEVSLGNRTERFNEHNELIGVEYDNSPAPKAINYKPSVKAEPFPASHVFEEPILEGRIALARSNAINGVNSKEKLTSQVPAEFEKKLSEKLAEGYTIDFTEPFLHLAHREFQYHPHLAGQVPILSKVMLKLPQAALEALADAAETNAREQYAADVTAAQAAYMESELARRIAEHQEAVRREREQAEAELADVLMREIAAELEAANTQPAPAAKKTTKSKTV